MLFSVLSGKVLAVKPTDNLAAAQKVNWNLSGAVMPSPPWGLHDIVGSDTSSKLIVNQPNGNTEVAITGVMNGLLPNTTYTVYPSNAWSTHTVWNVQGDYTIDLVVNGTPYVEYLVLTQTGGSITGQSLALNEEQTQSRWNIDSGVVSGNSITINAHYGSNTSMQIVMTGTIGTDGSITGSWHDVGWNTRSGNWHTTAGNAVSSQVGNGYPGLFNGQ